LALIFGPNLLQAPEGSDGTALIKDMPLINQIAANLITHCESLFKDTHLQNNYIGFLQAKFDYEKKTEGELSFQTGDMMWLMDKHSSGWWKGEFHGIVGYVPDTFVMEYNFLENGKPTRARDAAHSAPGATFSPSSSASFTPTTTTSTGSSATTQPVPVAIHVAPAASLQSIRVRQLVSPASPIANHTNNPTPTTIHVFNNSNNGLPSTSFRKQPANTISSPSSVIGRSNYNTNNGDPTDPLSYSQVRKGVSASCRTPRVAHTPLDAERNRKKERRKVGVRRGSHTNPNGSNRPNVAPNRGPDVSLLEKMAIFEKGTQDNTSISTRSYPVVGENGEKLAGSNIVMDRMTLFEKTE